MKGGRQSDISLSLLPWAGASKKLWQLPSVVLWEFLQHRVLVSLPQLDDTRRVGDNEPYKEKWRCKNKMKSKLCSFEGKKAFTDVKSCSHFHLRYMSCPKWIWETTNSPGRLISWPESQNINSVSVSLNSETAPFFHLCYSSQPKLCHPFLPSAACHPLAAHQRPRGTRKAVSSERVREQWSMCGVARGQGGKEACRAGLGSPVAACGTILPVRRSHSRWGNTWFLFPKKVTSGKKDCFLQKGIKTMLIKHCACLSALAQCALLIQRLQRWLWDRFHLWCHLDDFARNTAGWRCRKLANLLQQTCTQDAKQPRCTVSSSSSSQWKDQASLWVTPSPMPHSAHCLSAWPSSPHHLVCLSKGNKQNTACVTHASSNSSSRPYFQSISNFPLPGAKEEAISLPNAVGKTCRPKRQSRSRARWVPDREFWETGKLCCLLLHPSLLQPPQTQCKANTDNTATRGWAEQWHLQRDRHRAAR